jgi:hypothetical protein
MTIPTFLKHKDNFEVFILKLIIFQVVPDMKFANNLDPSIMRHLHSYFYIKNQYRRF